MLSDRGMLGFNPCVRRDRNQSWECAGASRDPLLDRVPAARFRNADELLRRLAEGAAS